MTVYLWQNWSRTTSDTPDMQHDVFVAQGEELSQYHFGAMHPFGPLRYPAFINEFNRRALGAQVSMLRPVLCSDVDLSLFHTAAYIQRVKQMSVSGSGYLDGGDTPAFIGMYEVTRYIVGTTLEGVRRIMRGENRRGFNPIGGLHHAGRDYAAGFCIFNDCGVAIEVLKKEYGLRKIAYVDIDAHHGDGVFYGFEDDPAVCFVDFHEDGRYLYPGTGREDEIGKGQATGMKLNIPMPMYANDAQFLQRWQQAEKFVYEAQPEFILLQCGADSLKGDPITHLHYSADIHSYVTQRLSLLAERLGHGRLLAMGGGGYDLKNISQAWCSVVEAMLRIHPEEESVV
jgi:acetoin utilization protein AcuC